MLECFLKVFLNGSWWQLFSDVNFIQVQYCHCVVKCCYIKYQPNSSFSSTTWTFFCLGGADVFLGRPLGLDGCFSFIAIFFFTLLPPRPVQLSPSESSSNSKIKNTVLITWLYFVYWSLNFDCTKLFWENTM